MCLLIVTGAFANSVFVLRMSFVQGKPKYIFLIYYFFLFSEHHLLGASMSLSFGQRNWQCDGNKHPCSLERNVLACEDLDINKVVYYMLLGWMQDD